jgi:hypothetical protein
MKQGKLEPLFKKLATEDRLAPGQLQAWSDEVSFLF